MAVMGSLVGLSLLKQGMTAEFAASLHSVFLFGMVIALAAMAACCWLKEKPLEEKRPEDGSLNVTIQ